MLDNGGEIVFETENESGCLMWAAFEAYFGNTWRLDVVKILLLHGAPMTCTSRSESIMGCIGFEGTEELRKWTKSLIDDNVFAKYPTQLRRIQNVKAINIGKNILNGIMSTMTTME